MSYVLIVDVSHWQKPGLPWGTFKAHGVAAGFVQVSHGLRLEKNAGQHVADILVAGLKLGLYHWLTPLDDAGAQARLFVAQIPSGFRGRLAVDVEEPGTTAAQLDAFLAEFKRLMPGRRIRIYTAVGVWHQLIGHHVTRFAEYPLWAAGGVGYDQVESLPPPGYKLTLPDTWAEAEMEQFTGKGRVVGYAEDLDLSFAVGINTPEALAAVWEDHVNQLLPPRTGSLWGGHTQGFSSITPIYRQLKENFGVVPTIVIYDEDAGKGPEMQTIGVPTRICRLQFKETGDDHDFEGGGGGRLGWPDAMVRRFITAAVDMPYRRTGIGEFQAATLWQVTGNEWDNQTIEGWMKDLDMLLQVLIESTQRSTHDKAMLMGISDSDAAKLNPVKYILPIFNAGTPHQWADYVAIAKHPIWRYMAANGHVLGAHEGIAFDQPFDWGEKQKVSPDAPLLSGAGLVNFRVYNLLWLLAAQGIYLNWAVLEWYDGRRGRETDIVGRIANMIRHDLLLAASPWARYCLGYCQYEFTDDPGSKWYAQDCTLIWKHPLWAAHLRGQIGRINGGNPIMPVTWSDPDFLALTVLVDKYRKHTMGGLTDQAVINLFNGLFGGLTLLEAQLSDAQRAALYAKDASGARSAFYSGPAVEDMAHLTPDQKSLVIANLPK